MKTLQQIPIGTTTKVIRVHGTGALRRRIMDMGITKGVDVYVCGAAPLGDPMEIEVRGYKLTLRKDDMKLIEVE